MMFSDMRSGAHGFGLPSPTRFQSGHLPQTLISRPRIHDDSEEDSGSASDNAPSIDSEGIYGRRSSLDSWPQSYKYQKTSQYQRDKYVYSDVSSSRDTLDSIGPNKRGLGMGNLRYEPVLDDDESDSSEISEFSTSAPCEMGRDSAQNVVSMGKKHAKNMQNEEFSHDSDVPSAPPIFGSREEAKQCVENITASGIEDSDNISTTTRFKKANPEDNDRNGTRTTTSASSSNSHRARLPIFNASTQGPWLGMIAYDACVRLCLHAWAKGCVEAPMFLESECALLRDVFSLRQVLLQSEDELLVNRSSGIAGEGVAPKPNNIIGKMKVQACKVKIAMDSPTNCNCSSLKAPTIRLESFRYLSSSIHSTFSSGKQAIHKVRVLPCIPSNGSASCYGLSYVHASTHYIKQISRLLKTGVTTLRSSSLSYTEMQETYACLLRLKSSSEEDTIPLQPGSGEAHIFFPRSLGDDLIVEVQDSKGNQYGRALVQVAVVADNPGDKLRWWSIYHEPEHKLVGKIQLNISYFTSLDETSKVYGSVAETVAYDLVLEVAMKVQHFQQRNLLLHGEWKWLLTEFSSYYGVSDAYTKLRYLSYIMDVATPTADCLTLIYNLLLPVVMMGHSGTSLSHQENRLLGEIKDQIEQILSLLFQNYKSLDESLPSGIVDVFRPATGFAAPALQPAVKLYSLLCDILSPEAQNSLVHYIQVAAKKRSLRHLAETDEFVTNSENNLTDALAVFSAYRRMKSLCLNIRNEISTDIEIHNQHILPSFIDLPNLSSSIYSTELCNRLRAFLIVCPPSEPSPHVADLVIATANFQRDLSSWNIKPVRGGVDAKELFHLYIMIWIQDKRLSLLESCKLDKVKWSGVKTQYSTTPFIDDMYGRLMETMNDYEVIICRWPEYTSVLENAMADIEKAIVEALDKQYSDVLVPLKESLAPKKFGLKYVQKLANRSTCSSYVTPNELGILLNSMKRMLDILRPKVESKLKSWGSCIPDGDSSIPGERLSEVTVMLRAKFRNYMQAVVEKLANNSRLQNSTKLKKILQDSKHTIVESDVQSKMHPLTEQLTNTINQLHTIFETHVFIAVCRGYWDQMGQDILNFLENRKENRLWYKGSRVAISVLDNTFASQMQQLLGNVLQDKDVEPPRSIMEVRSMLCKDMSNRKESTYYY